MNTVTAADGTRIAYDRYGAGPAIILVTGAMGYRKFKKFEQIAPASLWGWSSGGAVALRAAAADIGVEKLVVYETPFKTDPAAKYPTDDYGERLEQIVAQGDPMRAARHFMRSGIGLPGPMVAHPGRWPRCCRTHAWSSFRARATTCHRTRSCRC